MSVKVLWRPWVASFIAGTLVFYGSYQLGRVTLAGVAPETPPHGVGSIVPNVIVYLEDGAGVPLGRVGGDRPFTLLSVVTPGCTSCLAEAARWRDVHQGYRDSLDVIVVAATPDKNWPRQLREVGGLPFPVLRVDDEARRQLAASVSPTIYVLDWEGRVVFVGVGPTATVDAEGWLRHRFEG